MNVNEIQNDVIIKIKKLITTTDYNRKKTNNEKQLIKDISGKLQTLKNMKKPHVVVVRRTKHVRIER